MNNSRYTPFQKDIIQLIDALGIELTRIGVADEALLRRIVQPDNGGAEQVHVHNSTTSDPTHNEAARRLHGQQQRDLYNDSIQTMWRAFRHHRQNTDSILHNEPVIPHTGIVCATKTCTNYASDHQHPTHNTTIDDLCDNCWTNICTTCYLRPMDLYRKTCDACRKRLERAA